MADDTASEPQTREERIAANFARDTAEHVLEVQHDDGLYRHLHARRADRSGAHHFDIVTWPGYLTIAGDFGDAWTFTRLPDMFQFFRSEGRTINPDYWAQKVADDPTRAQKWSEDVFKREASQMLNDALDYPPMDITPGETASICDSFRRNVLATAENGPDAAYEALRNWSYNWVTPGRGGDPDEWTISIETSDVYPSSFQDWTPGFLWACHAIAWAIAEYDRDRHSLAHELLRTVPALELAQRVIRAEARR